LEGLLANQDVSLCAEIIELRQRNRGAGS
jgi:hypothetical protein